MSDPPLSLSAIPAWLFPWGSRLLTLRSPWVAASRACMSQRALHMLLGTQGACL